MFSLEDSISQLPWNHGVNILGENEFHLLAEIFLKWCKQQKTNRICIVSHDGTITAYRQFIEGVKLSRNDFPKETGCIKIGY